MKLEAVRSAAMALPGSMEEPHHDFGSFRVGGKVVGVRIAWQDAKPAVVNAMVQQAHHRKLPRRSVRAVRA